MTDQKPGSLEKFAVATPIRLSLLWAALMGLYI